MPSNHFSLAIRRCRCLAAGLAALTFAILAPVANAAPTDLATGDLAIIGIHTDVPDKFVFVPMVDLSADTVITFTDKAWVAASNSFGSGVAYLEWKAGGIVMAGTAVEIATHGAGPATVSAGVVQNTRWGLQSDHQR